jgi:hypothetical protein
MILPLKKINDRLYFMIIHLSIPALEPEKVAKTLAKLIQGTFQPLSWYLGGYMVFTNDEFSTGIEILPDNTLFMPGKTSDDTLQITKSSSGASLNYSCIHFLLTIDSSYEHIFVIAKQAGWQAVRKQSLGVVDMVEFWVENRLMIELVLRSNQTKTIRALQNQHYLGVSKL